MSHPFTDDGDGLYCTCGRIKGHPEHADAVLPDLPYAGTSGWSGSETSRERAEDADADGTTSERQAQTLASLAGRHRAGITWKELGVARGWHHGQASGVLSVLHKTGRIARLTERRERCLVYVLPEYVDGRETKPHGGRRDLAAEIEGLCVAAEEGGESVVAVAALRALLADDS